VPSYIFEGLRPVIHPSAFIHPTAVLIGDVFVGANCYVGPGSALRGDIGRLIMKAGSNLQDNCIMHSFPGRECLIEACGHVGHGAVLHGCTVGRNALIGMNSVIMDNAEIGEDCIIGAMSFVKAGTVTEAGSLWAGSPARLIRQVTEEERAWKAQGTAEYQGLARRCLATLVECEPLTEEEAGRQRSAGTYKPLTEVRR
jgi:phenylacetic acid degradation protein